MTQTVPADGQKRVAKTVQSQPRVVGMVYRRMTPDDLLALVHQTAVNEGVNPKLFESLIRVESTGKICVTSSKGARGITQLMPGTARRFGLRVDNLIDERCDLLKGLMAGAKYLRFQLDTFKDVRLALAGYNAGEGAVIQYGWKIPPYKETVQYVEQICALTYGRTGLALEKAYNQQQAYFLIDALYRGRAKFAARPLVVEFPTQTTAVNRGDNQITQNQSSVTPASDAANQDSSEKVPPARKTIRVTDLEPRIATRALSFWNQSQK